MLLRLTDRVSKLPPVSQSTAGVFRLTGRAQPFQGLYNKYF